ncbi:DUF5666 domain-containing protein [Helicobacter brantae]|uniref:DUF5666 domain-containing protein n=1 Tax=Helicobacter brantae TaxID=375927 RepID=A0A3D8J4J2_9HELI|nr:DUF5666 domain-containing protein [Helicobacter brantae]RDU71794.1 hypothetical protein CQA58_01765 [Helicobacter brantae]
MKNLLVSAILGAMCVSGLSAMDLKGMIEGIDDSSKTIQVNGNTIKVMPYTKIKQESCGIGWDSAKKFVDLKKGDFIKVDLSKNSQKMVAEKIKIKCVKNPAY